MKSLNFSKTNLIEGYNNVGSVHSIYNSNFLTLYSLALIYSIKFIFISKNLMRMKPIAAEESNSWLRHSWKWSQI